MATWLITENSDAWYNADVEAKTLHEAHKRLCQVYSSDPEYLKSWTTKLIEVEGNQVLVCTPSRGEVEALVLSENEPRFKVQFGDE